MKDWGIFANRNFPIAIAGPCSAETENQLRTIASELKKINISMLRAGIWKPRTRPGSFEGVGEEGLKWLKTIKKEFNIPIIVEVANTKHVELCLKYGVDVLWVGARTTVNPFSVQEIADALKGVDIPIMVKNPINPELPLWKGAIERFYRVGLNKIAAIHRGFNSFEKTKYRNIPLWQIPIALRAEFPNISMVCDPSHIGGTRELILPISQRAIDYSYDGLMVETHHDPENAWSDAKQQITPQVLDIILHEIAIKKPKIDDSEFNTKLEQLRKQIDIVDNEIIDALASRFKIVNQMGEYKRQNNVTVFQAQRWIQIFQDRPQLAEKMGISKAFVEQLYKLIHDESLGIQTRIIDQVSEVI